MASTSNLEAMASTLGWGTGFCYLLLVLQTKDYPVLVITQAGDHLQFAMHNCSFLKRCSDPCS